MQDINEVVKAKLNEIQQNGVIEKLIGDNVEKAVSKAVEEAFGSYGAITKAISAAIKDGFQLDSSQLDFGSYNAVMLAAIKQKAFSAFSNDARSKFMQDIERVLEPAPASISVHDFVTRIAEIWRDQDDEDYDQYASVVCKPAFDSPALSKDGSKNLMIRNKKSSGGYMSSSNRNAQIDLFISDEVIRISHRMIFNPTCLDEVEGYIFKLYAAGTKITGIQDYDPDDHEYEIRRNNDY